MATITMELTSNGLIADRKNLSPHRTGRKLSIPVNLSHPQESAAFRRRFSNVGDAARKLSSSIGWRSASGANPQEEIMTVGKGLCVLYIRTRLKRAGVFNKKLGLTRVKSAIGTLEGCGSIVREIFPAIQCACSEMERLHPKVFTKVARQTGVGSSGAVAGLLLGIGHQLMIRTEPNWGKIIAIYCVAAGLAVDVVRQGRPECLHSILADMTELFEDRMAMWINANGGWAGLTAHCRPQNQEIPMKEYLTIFGFITVVLLIAYFVIKCCSKFGS